MQGRGRAISPRPGPGHQSAPTRPDSIQNRQIGARDITVLLKFLYCAQASIPCCGQKRRRPSGILVGHHINPLDEIVNPPEPLSEVTAMTTNKRATKFGVSNRRVR